MRSFILALAVCVPSLVAAQSAPEIITAVVDGHILPRYDRLHETSGSLQSAAQAECHPNSELLQSAYHDAFDAWIAVSHITFGPAEDDNRFFALSFWPDSRGMTARSLSALMADRDPIIATAEGFGTVSVAARGFYALEFLLFDADLSAAGDPDYHCALIRAITTDIHRSAGSILAEWQTEFAPLMRNAGQNDRFQSPDEALRALLGALVSGLEFTADLRLGRPMGTSDTAYPRRAEAWRSGRSLRHVRLSLASLAELADLLASANPDIRQTISDAFATAQSRAEALNDPVFAGVVSPQGRLRVEVLQQRVRDVRDVVTTRLGPELGVAAGFNSLDGD